MLDAPASREFSSNSLTTFRTEVMTWELDSSRTVLGGSCFMIDGSWESQGGKRTLTIFSLTVLKIVFLLRLLLLVSDSFKAKTFKQAIDFEMFGKVQHQ